MSGPSTREQQLEAQVEDLIQALGEAHLEARVWKIRVAPGMPTTRFCSVIGVPSAPGGAGSPAPAPGRRSRGRGRARPARSSGTPPAGTRCRTPRGHRKVWAMCRHDGHRVSRATVLRLLRDEGFIPSAAYQQ